MQSKNFTRKDLTKTALGADEVVPWVHYQKSEEAINYLEQEKILPIVIEQTVYSSPLYEIDFEYPVCFIFGNEVTGVSENVAKRVKLHAEISMEGIKQSLNVAVSAGVVGYEAFRRYSFKK